MKEQTILEVFQESVKANAAEVSNLEKQMAGRVKDVEKTLERTRADLMRERALFDKLRGEYEALEGNIEAEVRAGLEQTEITKARVDRGEASLDDFLKAGGEPELRKRARAAASEKLAEALKLIRAKRAEIYRLEALEAEALLNISYGYVAAPQLRREKMKLEAEAFDRALNPVVGAYTAAVLADEKAKDNLQACRQAVNNVQWEGVGLDEIRALKFDPRIREEWLDGLEKFIAAADPDKKFNGLLRAMPSDAGTPAGLYFSEA
jgi:hypothetical protein